MLNYTLIQSSCTIKACRKRLNINHTGQHLSLVLYIALMMSWPTANAQTKLELEKLDNTLKQSEQSLQQDKAKREQINANIQSLEEQIAERTLRYDQTQRKVNTMDKQAERILAERDSLDAQFSRARKQLSNLLESAYLMGRQSSLKVALSPEGAQHMTRLNHYAQNIADARQLQLDTLTSLQDRLIEKNSMLATQRLKTQKLSTALQSDQSYLNQLKSNRLTMVRQLDLSISSGTAEVAHLRKRKAQLETLLEKIAVRQKARAARKKAQQKRLQAARVSSTTQARDNRQTVTKNTSFELIPGTLPMPSKAKIVARFGDKRKNSGLPWSGILMEGRDGSHIKAISDGEVVYADWLQGYGQMVIVDHGNGIMSLYGHNKRILKAVGEKVRQSDTIATMGDTAGLKRAGLYFEIRQNGVARDPLIWCRI